MTLSRALFMSSRAELCWTRAAKKARNNVLAPSAPITAVLVISALLGNAGCGEDNGGQDDGGSTRIVEATRSGQPAEPTGTPLRAEPTNAPAPATAAPAPAVLSGVGQQASDFFPLVEGLTIFRMMHTGGSNFAIWLMDGSTGDQIELLVNEIGPFDGAKAVGVNRSGNYLLDVTADGSWSVTVEQPRDVAGAPVPPQITGRGQQVTQLLALQEGLARIEMTHDGQSNFAIWLLDDGGAQVDLLVNEIGSFSGSKAVQVPDDGNYLLDVTADGNWTIVIEQ